MSRRVHQVPVRLHPRRGETLSREDLEPLEQDADEEALERPRLKLVP